MLRLPEPQRNSRLGGWALMESLPQRTATSGQRWSLAIMVAATLVAIAAVAFDIRLSSEVSLASGPITLPTTESTQRAAPETATAATVTTQSAAINRPADDTAEFASISPDDPSPTPTEPTSPAQSEQPTSSATSPAEPTASTFADAEVSSTEASTPALDDPPSRIREYLELSPGAQLPVSFRYEVQEGDTASSIAAQFGLEEATVLFNNFDIYDPDQLSVGQLLLLPPVDGLVYIVQSGDTLDAVLLNFQADMEETLAWPANEISSPEQIYAGQPLLLVRGSASLAGGGSPSADTGSPATSCA